MEILTLDFVEGARAARGVAVIIDVFRAFTTACQAFENGAERILPAGTIEEALTLKSRHPDAITLGERHARPLPGFDYGNSPILIEPVDFTGRTLIHTTHSGTQGLVHALQADVVLTGSLVNASAVCQYIRSLSPRTVSLVRMGHEATERCEEDDVCAELLAAHLRGELYDLRSIRPRLARAASAAKFFDKEAPWAPERDFELCTQVDRHDFVLRLVRTPGEPLQLYRSTPSA